MLVDISFHCTGRFKDVPYGELFIFTGPGYPPLCKRIDKSTFFKLDDNCIYQVALCSEDEPVRYNSNTPAKFN